MRPGNLQSANGRLQEAFDTLSLVWNETSEHWRDQNARHVEEEMLEPIGEEVAKALPAISHMAQLFGQAARELNE